jgi:hypothetical protein
MSALNFLNHVLNFAAPAFFVALLLALFGRLAFHKPAAAMTLWKQMALNFVAGVVVLVIGLAVFGNDGHMATYAALVLVCGIGQWLLARGWRR